jgi:hypothetical protein
LWYKNNMQLKSQCSQPHPFVYVLFVPLTS